MDVTARSSTAPRREIQPKRQRRARLHPFPRIPLVCQWKQSPPSSSREVREFQGYKELSDSLRTPSEWGKSVFLLALQEITALANCKLPIMQYYFTWLDCCIQQLVHKSVCVCVCATGVQPVQHEDSEGPVVCWERLGLPDLDCKEKTAWISTGSLTGDLIQPTMQEIWTRLNQKTLMHQTH